MFTPYTYAENSLLENTIKVFVQLNHFKNSEGRSDSKEMRVFLRQSAIGK